jgi:hypothetical protein
MSVPGENFSYDVGNFNYDRFAAWIGFLYRGVLLDTQALSVYEEG